MALSRCGVNTSTSCHLCANALETSDHLLVRYPYARDVIYWIFKRCDLPSQDFNTVKEFVGYAANSGRCAKKRKKSIAIIYGMLWFVWGREMRELLIATSSLLPKRWMVSSLRCIIGLSLGVVLSTVFRPYLG